MILYTLYEDGGGFVEKIEVSAPLRAGRKINLKNWKVGIVRATRRDVALIFDNDPDITAIAYIKRIKPLP